MNTTAHPVAPEDLMALLDGELSGTFADSVATHLAECEECASLAAQLRDTSQSLARWTVPSAPPEMRTTLKEAAADAAYRHRATSGESKPPIFGLYWKPLAVAAGLVVAVFLGLLHSTSRSQYEASSFRPQRQELRLPQRLASSALDSSNRLPTQAEVDALRMRSDRNKALSLAATTAASGPEPSAGIVASTDGPLASSAATNNASDSNTPPSSAPPVSGPPNSGPMIARTVNLTIVAKDFTAARATLDRLLARHNAYFAQLDVNTQEEGFRTLNASLRVPAPDLSATLAELRAIGRVLNESQSGEEVTQQHQDLVARLETARETEARFRAILQQRTGSLADVLSVEESIARVRGEIEQMEAEQKNLEHRVDFATIELRISEEYKAQLNLPDNSVATRFRNAFVAGYHHAAETILGIVFFIEEFGPAILIWLIILALPVLAWRRYRRLRSRL